MLNNGKDPVRFEPLAEAGKPEAERRVYLLKPPTVYERATYRRAMAAKGAGRRPGLLEIAEELRRGIVELIPGPEGDGLLKIVDAYSAALTDLMEGGGEPALKMLLAVEEELNPISAQMRRAWPAFAELESERIWYEAVAGIEGARLFLVGWENGPATFTRTVAGVDDDLLGLISENDLREIGDEIQRLLAPGAAQAKNSDSPSPSSSVAKTSTAAKTQPKPTRSKTTPGISRK